MVQQHIPRRASAHTYVTRQVEPIEEEYEEEEYVPRPRRTRQFTIEQPVTQHQVVVKRSSWKAPLTIGAVLVLLVYLFLRMIVVPYFQGLYFQWHTGDAKVVQADIQNNNRVDHVLVQQHGYDILIVVFLGSGASKSQTFSFHVDQTNVDQIIVKPLTVNGKTNIEIDVGDSGVASILYDVGNGYSWTQK